ncbi:TTF-type zinc finger protein with HAT dimerization domain [Zea mays]|uniref:TTF-type zinc finger protein with HAT dimerization domain n=1 Tax=Zea mays TaxID=4577 RepID=A0A1D6Q141_MAIZE|nr:TTF-type zinc finger protein with HAT dimerization domain [Zea mays]
MKRKNSGTTDLRAFLARAVAKKQSEQTSVAPSCNERHMQLVIFQERSNGGTCTIPSEQVKVEVEPPTIEHGEDSSDSESAHLNQFDSSDEGDRDGIYGIEHNPSLRLPISSYDVNDQDTIRRAYVALGPCRPNMNKDIFPQPECGDNNKFPGGDSFVSGGFRNWNMKVRFLRHAGAWWRDQDIVNAMDLLDFTKVELDVLRKDTGWEEFLKNVNSFCEKHKVKIVDMDEKQLVELNNRFDEVNTELLRCMPSFSPAKNFSAFDVEKLVKLAGHYPHDFQFEEKAQLPFQLNRYIEDVRNDENFKNLKVLAKLSMMLVKTDKILRYDIVYKLLKLVLVLPVATAGDERIFSSMNYIKNKLRSKMGQKILNGCLVTFIEREFFLYVKDEDIIAQFQSMKDQKVRL